LKKIGKNNYDDLEISPVKKMSNGTLVVSVGSSEDKTEFNEDFHFYHLLKRLAEQSISGFFEIELINIIFKSKVCFDFKKTLKLPALKFSSCTFIISPTFIDEVFENKVKFQLCIFNNLRVNNSTFNEYVEFFECIFFKKMLILKSSFNKNVVFTKSTFKENCLFTYSIFEKQGIFSRAIFRDKNNLPTGLDLSQSIVNGQLTFFETDLGNYEAKRINSNSEEYDEAISEGGKIPIQNKRETFRIIKHQLLQQNNVIEAEKYDKLEKQTLLYETYKNFKIKNISNLFLLLLNKYSNNYKTSWLYALIFTFSVASLSHSILSISESNDFCDGLKFIKLLNPFDFSFYSDAHSGKAYTVYFLAKISIGFGIYQLIQAFRKYR
jgi:hypothetical protein